MSDENVGGLPELPDSPFWNLQNEPFYTAEQMHAYARAALSAHGQPEPNGKLVGWWNGITPNVLDRGPYIEPSIRWGADGEDSRHDIPLYDGYNPIHYVTPPAHGQPVVDAELMKRVLGAPYDGVTVGDFFVYADFSEHDTLGVVRAIVAAALGATP